MRSTGAGRALALTLLFSFGCGGGLGGTDSGPPPIDGGAGLDAPLPPEATASIAPIVAALELTTAMSAPLGADGDMLRRDAAPTDGEAQDRASHGFSGGSVVEPPTCVAYTWSGLSASVVMTGCSLESTGTPLDGTLTLAITTRPTAFTLSFTDLSIDGGASTYDGSITARMMGTDLMGETFVDVMLGWDTPGGTGQLAATDLQVEGTAETGVSVSGNGTATIDGSTTMLTATDLTWAPMECLPSSGTLLVSGPPFPLPTTLTFLSTTPATGIVRLQVGSFPAIEQMLLEPCP